MMQINSIFLPSQLPDNSLIGLKSEEIKTFSHLFSNVYSIVNDEQENFALIKVQEQNSDLEQSSPFDYLNVTLKSDNKLNDGNFNLSSFIASYLSHINGNNQDGNIADSNKIKYTSENQKFFSLSKNNFIKEIKNILKALNKSQKSATDNYRIIIKTNGSELEINNQMNSDKFDKWILQQFKQGNNFEIVVKHNSLKQSPLMDSDINVQMDDDLKLNLYPDKLDKLKSLDEQLGDENKTLSGEATPSTNESVKSHNLNSGLILQTENSLTELAVKTINSDNVENNEEISEKNNIRKDVIVKAKNDLAENIKNINSRVITSQISIGEDNLAEFDFVDDHEKIYQSNLKENQQVTTNASSSELLNSLSVSENNNDIDNPDFIKDLKLVYDKVDSLNIDDSGQAKTLQSPDENKSTVNNLNKNNQSRMNDGSAKSSAEFLKDNSESLTYNESSKNQTGASEKSDIKKELSLESLEFDNEYKSEEFFSQMRSSQNYSSKEKVKIDLMQRRLYSQIPPLEIISEEEKNTTKNQNTISHQTKENKTNFVDTTSDKEVITPDSKLQNEKQVWVKISLEKSNKYFESDAKEVKPSTQKITLDQNEKNTKNNFSNDDYLNNQMTEDKKEQPQIKIEDSGNKSDHQATSQNHNSNNQESSFIYKPNLGNDHSVFKTTLQDQGAKLYPNPSGMTEKIKIISANEMLKEVYKVMENGDKQSIVLKIEPKEMGSIKIMLDTVDNILNAKVEVQNESVGNLIRNNIDLLKQNLLQSGVQINSINISYSSSDQKQNAFHHQKKRSSSYLQTNESDNIEDAIVVKQMGYNTYEFLA